MTPRASAMLAGVVLTGLSGIGVAVFSVVGATANPFSGYEPPVCSPGQDCSADTFAASTTSGTGFACDAELTACIDLGPGASDYVGTNGSGNVIIPGGVQWFWGDSTYIQAGVASITNGALMVTGSTYIQNGSGPVRVTDTDGLALNATSAITGFLLVAVTVDIASIDASSCNDVTATVTGVEANDYVHVTPNFDMVATEVTVGNARVTNAGTDEVTFRACNLDVGSPQDPASGSFLFWVARKA